MGRRSAGKHVSKGMCIISSRQGTVSGCAGRLDLCFSLHKHLSVAKSNRAVLLPAYLASGHRVLFSYLRIERMGMVCFTLRHSIPRDEQETSFSLISTAKRPPSFTSPPQHRPFKGVGLGDGKAFPFPRGHISGSVGGNLGQYPGFLGQRSLRLSAVHCVPG